jgi:hypothetical protein
MGKSGLGLVELLVSLVIVAGLMYLVVRQHHSPSINAATQKRIESQGLAVPSGVDLNQSKQVEKMVQDQLKQADTAHQKSIDCNAGDAKSCAP